MMEPVAYISEYGMSKLTSGNHYHGKVSPLHHGERVVPLVRLSDAEARIAELDEEIGRLEDENSDLRCEPWPEWARAVLKVIRKHSGYDGYDDATEGVDMPLELSEHLSEMEAEADRWKARAEAAEALLKEAGKVLEPFASGRHEVRNTHLLDWLPEGYDHCRLVSKDWAQAYLNSAKDYIEAFESAARSLASKIGGGE